MEIPYCHHQLIHLEFNVSGLSVQLAGAFPRTKQFPVVSYAW